MTTRIGGKRTQDTVHAQEKQADEEFTQVNEKFVNEKTAAYIENNLNSLLQSHPTLQKLAPKLYTTPSSKNNLEKTVKKSALEEITRQFSTTSISEENSEKQPKIEPEEMDLENLEAPNSLELLMNIRNSKKTPPPQMLPEKIRNDAFTATLETLDGTLQFFEDIIRTLENPFTVFQNVLLQEYNNRGNLEACLSVKTLFEKQAKIKEDIFQKAQNALDIGELGDVIGEYQKMLHELTAELTKIRIAHK